MLDWLVLILIWLTREELANKAFVNFNIGYWMQRQIKKKKVPELGANIFPVYAWIKVCSTVLLKKHLLFPSSSRWSPLLILLPKVSSRSFGAYKGKKTIIQCHLVEGKAWAENEIN